MKILALKYTNLYSKIPAEYTRNTSPCEEIPDYKNEISNICYRPTFTSKKDMPDEEYVELYNKIKGQLNSHKRIPQENINKALSYVNKDNVRIAERLSRDDYGFINGESINLLKIINSENNDIANFILYTGNVDKREINIDSVIEAVNKDNHDFAMSLLEDKKFTKFDMDGILKYVNKNTLPLAQYLYEHKYNNTMFYFEDLLRLYDKDPIECFEQICRTNYLSMREEYPDDIAKIFSKDISQEDLDLMKYLYNCDYIGRKASKDLFEIINTKTLPIFKTTAEYSAGAYDMVTNMETFNANDKYLKEQNINELIERVKYQKALVDKSPDKYIATNDLTILTNRYLDWEVHSPKDVQHRFFTTKFVELMLVASLLDKESMDALFRKRTNAVQKFTEKIALDMDYEDLKLLKGLISSKNIYGREQTPTEKLELVDLYRVYKQSNISFRNMLNMQINDCVDINELKRDIYKYTMSLAGISETGISKIPLAKLYGWNINYIHNIANDLSNHSTSKALKDLIYSATLNDFRSYINDYTNIYGLANASTQKYFQCYGLDYSKWLNPSSANNILFKNNDKTTNNLDIIIEHITEDIEELRSSNPEMKKFIDKSFPKCIKNGKFVVPKEYTKNRANLDKFTKGLINGLKRIWKRAEENLNEFASAELYSSNNIQNSNNAINTLTIKNHLNARLKEINSCSNDPDIIKTEPLDLTIKMWDRNPQKDLFQGNYSTCCIGIGQTNGHYMPQYLMNTAFNMIEIVDNKSGNTIGNAMCYFANNNGQQVFVIDNIEINRNYIPAENIGKKLRTAIKEYAQNITKEVSGKDDIPIILGTKFNDVPTKDLAPMKNIRLSFIGDIASQSIYLDIYGGAVPKNSIYGAEVKAYPL